MIQWHDIYINIFKNSNSSSSTFSFYQLSWMGLIHKIRFQMSSKFLLSFCFSLCNKFSALYECFVFLFLSFMLVSLLFFNFYLSNSIIIIIIIFKKKNLKIIKNSKWNDYSLFALKIPIVHMQDRISGFWQQIRVRLLYVQTDHIVWLDHQEIAVSFYLF